MLFENIDVRNVRIFTHAVLPAAPGLNLIYGQNGSGKTSLLESINLLARARSFRTSKLANVIRKGAAGMQVAASLRMDNGRRVVSGMERIERTTRIRFDGEEIKQVSQQARNLPVLLLTPESQGLLSGTPKDRRRWLDWMMFHVEPGYLQAWSNYHKALRQRNQLLRRNAQAGEYLPWEQKLASEAPRIDGFCTDAVMRLQHCFENALEPLLPGAGKVGFCPGWDRETSLAGLLEKGRLAEKKTGYTRFGPHRADLLFQYEQQPAAQALSRGQAKLYMVALLLAQAEVIVDVTGQKPMVLIDDVFAELDKVARQRLSSRLSELDLQCFITSTDEAMMDYCSAVFHVEHGCVKKQIRQEINQEYDAIKRIRLQ